ncbi:hypothetical protein ACK3TF_004641 [Chlorella vulgaris]
MPPKRKKPRLTAPNNVPSGMVRYTWTVAGAKKGTRVTHSRNLTQAEFQRLRVAPGGNLHKREPSKANAWQLRHLNAAQYFVNPTTGKPVTRAALKAPKNYTQVHRILWLQELCKRVSALKARGLTVEKAYLNGDLHWYDTLLGYATGGLFWGGFARYAGQELNKPKGPYKAYAQAVIAINEMMRPQSPHENRKSLQDLRGAYSGVDRQSQGAIDNVLDVTVEPQNTNRNYFRNRNSNNSSNSNSNDDDGLVDDWLAERSKAKLLGRLAFHLCEQLWAVQRRQLATKLRLPSNITNKIKGLVRGP